jgi:hypothetical protein
MSHVRLWTALLFTGSLTAPGCSPVGLNCADVGCSSDLRVELDGEPATSFTLTARSDRSEHSLQCSRAAPCELRFPDYAPAQVTLTYEADGIEIEHMFEPSYTVLEPGGAGCGQCVSATVTLPIDGASSTSLPTSE